MNGLPPLDSAPALVGRVLRWSLLAALVLAALVLVAPGLLALGLVMVPLGLLLGLGLVLLALLGFGVRLPDWLACAGPDQAASLAAPARAVLLTLAVLLAVLLFGPVAVGLVLALLLALGWAGIGPLAPLAAVLRGLVALVGLLPRLGAPLHAAAEALARAARAAEAARDGLGKAENQLGQAKAALAMVAVPTIDAKPAPQTLSLPRGLGDVQVPGWTIGTGEARPFDGVVRTALEGAEQGLGEARGAAERSRAALDNAAAALAGLRALLLAERPPAG